MASQALDITALTRYCAISDIPGRLRPTDSYIFVITGDSNDPLSYYTLAIARNRGGNAAITSLEYTNQVLQVCVVVNGALPSDVAF